MGSVANPAGVVKPADGGRCPVCNNGILFLIAETADGEYLRCFNCDTSGTVHKTEEWAPSVDPTQSSPTGFQLTHDQLAAKGSVDVEQTTSRVRAGEPAPPTVTEPQAQVEPHEQHDVVPPAGDESGQGGGGGA